MADQGDRSSPPRDKPGSPGLLTTSSKAYPCKPPDDDSTMTILAVILFGLLGGGGSITVTTSEQCPP